MSAPGGRAHSSSAVEAEYDIARNDGGDENLDLDLDLDLDRDGAEVKTAAFGSEQQEEADDLRVDVAMDCSAGVESLA